MTGRVGRSCLVCGARTDGATRCPTHAAGGGTRPRTGLSGGARTPGADYCPDHAFRLGGRRDRQPWRAGYDTPEYRTARQAALDRDQHRCIQCGQPATDHTPLEVHHLTPLSSGGTHDLDNLATLCRPCHTSHTHRRQ